MPKNGRVSFAAFSCTHCPLQDQAAVDWALGILEAEQPDQVIHLGDLLEMDSASRWPSEYDFDFEDECIAADALLASIRKVTPKSTHVFLEGNHDANLMEWGRIDRRLRSALRLEKHIDDLKHWKQPCRYVYDRVDGVYRIGQVGFCHGYEAGQNADEFQSILMGSYHGLLVLGHTHRPTPGIMRAKKTMAVPLPYWYANVGALRGLKPHYMTRKRSHNWGQAMVIGEASPVKSPRMSREWSARVETFRISGDRYET